MPKYIPNHEDLYCTDPCFICGNYVLDFGKTTCSDYCEYLYEEYEKDFHFWNSINMIGEI